MTIRRANEADLAPLLRMSLALWPHSAADEHESELRECLARHDAAIFVAQLPGGELIGFLEVGIRDFAEDCATRHVGYIEAWFVGEEHRQQGVGAALVRAAEDWARGQGCREMASDCLLDNVLSLSAHLALGYEETSRTIHFVKPLK